MTNVPRRIDYLNIKIPLKEEKPPNKFSCYERRAEILYFILKTGNVRTLTQTAWAERYGVTQGQISQDMDAISDFIRRTSGKKIHMITEAVFTKGIEEYTKNGEYLKAAQILEKKLTWLFDIGKLTKAADKVEISGDTRRPLAVKWIGGEKREDKGTESEEGHEDGRE